MAGNPDEANLKKMLNMSLKLTDQELKELKPTEISEERKEFLNKAINQVLEEDEVKKLAYFNHMFLSFNGTDTYSEKQLETFSKLFEDILYLIEGKDIALEFNKMSGLTHCLKLLKSNYSSIQWRAADLLANALLNNPKCQKTVMVNKGMFLLLHTLKTVDVDIVKIKCVYALSALVGNNNEAEKLFIQVKGIDTLMVLIHANRGGDKIQIKSVFLLQKLLFSDCCTETDFVQIAADLVSVLMSEHNNMHEIIINIILEVIQQDKKNIEKIFPDKNKTIKFMHDRKSFLMNNDNNEKYLDEIFKYNEVLKLLA